METQYAVMLGFGALVLLAAWLPKVLDRVMLSLPIVCVLIGFAIFSINPDALDLVALREKGAYENLAGAALLVALMGAGLKVDRPIGWVRWSSAWRLLGIGMPLMALAAAALGHWWIGLAWPAAVFLAGGLTPTDPVLASDVSVGRPGVGEEGEARFALTVEAALNDGLAFPIVALAVAMANDQTIDASWLANDFLGRVAIAVVVGWTGGKALGWLIFRAPHPWFDEASAGLVAIGVTTATFALSQLLGGYGFISVFLTAVALRSVCPEDTLHKAMAGFSAQLERLLVLILLVLFGGEIATGLFAALDWQLVAVALVLLLVVRPITALVALIGSPAPWISRATTAFFGIRGVGAFYYLVYAAAHTHFPDQPELYALIGASVLGSVLIHGLSATPLMRRLDAERAESERIGRHPEVKRLTGES